MTPPRLENQAWMTAPETRAVMDALNVAGDEARFVGGCVRNALMGEPVDDVDIATRLPPPEVIRRLTDAGLRVVETGLAHGTVTAISGGRPFEITTLRVDVETDGRRANVAFVGDWAADAARRDFTINALYVNAAGDLFDYAGGLADIADRRVRFIGVPEARIEEDYLRILRFYRFFAWYGASAPDKAAEAAIASHLAGLKGLSAERVQKEFLRLLQARDPVIALKAMAQNGVLTALLPEALHIDRVERLLALGDGRDPVLRLAALIAPGTGGPVAQRLKLSNAMAERLAQLEKPNVPLTDEAALRRALYALGGPLVGDLARLYCASHLLTDTQCKTICAAAQGFEKPLFPLTGSDVLARGVPAGPRVGEILRTLESEWVDANFAGDRAALLKRLDAALES